MNSAPIYSNLDQALTQIKEWKEANLNIALTNGCFDILHKGHVIYLEQSKLKADKLIVGLNSDSSVKSLKGKQRPIQDQESRARIISALRSVDMVILFDQETPIHLIKAIKPDVIVKGGDYEENEMIGGQFVKSYGGQVVILTFEKGYSTSQIIDKIKRLGNKNIV